MCVRRFIQYSMKLLFYFTNQKQCDKNVSFFFFSKKTIEGGQIKRSTCFLIKRSTSICESRDFELQKVAINRTEMRAGYHYRVLRNNSRLCNGGCVWNNNLDKRNGNRVINGPCSCPLSWKRISSRCGSDSIWNTMIIAAAMEHNGIIES